VGRDNGLTDEQLLELDEYTTSPLFSEAERTALEYADRITFTDQDVDEELFGRVRELHSEEETIELTATICFENFLSKFHHTLLVESQGFCPVRLARTDGP
jgi:alkylhydroperoxidase family enzyme